MIVRAALLLAAICVVVLGMAYNTERNSAEEKILTRVIGISAKCKDGMYSTAAKKQGACSGHGGVQHWFID